KKVAKDMARWAKSMNDSRMNQKKSQPLMSAQDELAASEAAAADAGFAMLSKRKPIIIRSHLEADPEETKASIYQAMKTVENEAIVASYGGGSGSGSDSEEE
ncbi:hypothetical protein, partial [Salmonella sp. s55004]|uniref:hypothetical protein n=1 Tax=Salmonella sp. s55004 TaxID=3159675 RepID=UPI0039812AF4